MIAIEHSVLSAWNEILHNSSACGWQCMSFWQICLHCSWHCQRRKHWTCTFDAISIYSIQKRELFHVIAQTPFRQSSSSVASPNIRGDRDTTCSKHKIPSRVLARTAKCRTCPRKVPAVTTSALPQNTTKIQGSCPQRSSEALELSQGRLEALLPSHKSICQEIATSGHTRHWEGISGFLREPTFYPTTYPMWPSKELCAMLGQRVRDP